MFYVDLIYMKTISIMLIWFTAAMNHVLINCDEIQPYIE
jgi:hypothetical protein